MNPLVVDTNVAIVANGDASHAHDECRLACRNRLKSLVENEVIAIDDRWLILDEYRRHLENSRETRRLRGPSVGDVCLGDVFFKHVFDNQGNDNRVRRVTVTPLENEEDDRRGFEELPDNTFDHSDQKFLAVAVVAKAVILNAVDSDWTEHAALMKDLDVEVIQLCPQHAAR